MAEQESVYLWSTTALTNASVDTAINFAEGQLPGTLNNSNRAVMAALARYVKDTDGSLTTAGSANAYTLTINGRQTPLATGHRLSFKASFLNTGASTLAVTNADAVALGTKAIRGPGDVALVQPDHFRGRYDVVYDTAANSAAGAWLLLNPAVGNAAAPFDAQAYGGMQVNGSMEVSQENGTTAVTLATAASAKYIVDGITALYTHGAATAVFTGTQVTPPGSPSFGACFQQAVQLKSTTALSSPAIADYAIIEVPIEGYRASRLGFGNANAQSVTVGFWVYATIAGTMTVGLSNNARNRGIPLNVTISNATTWEYKTATFTGDTTGTWLLTTGIGLRVILGFAAGSSYQGTNNTWGTTPAFGTSSTTNFFSTNNNLVCVTGFGIWPGTDAPSSTRSPFVMRPYDQELLLSQRYLQNLTSGATSSPVSTGGMCFGTTSALLTRAVVPNLMSSPTLSVSAASDFEVINSAGSGVALTSLSINSARFNNVDMVAGTASGLVAGNATELRTVNTSAKFFLKAQL
jgi:hypothetical protein